MEEVASQTQQVEAGGSAAPGLLLQLAEVLGAAVGPESPDSAVQEAEVRLEEGAEG